MYDVFICGRKNYYFRDGLLFLPDNPGEGAFLAERGGDNKKMKFCLESTMVGMRQVIVKAYIQSVGNNWKEIVNLDTPCREQ